MLAHAPLIGTCREIACARVWVLFIDVVVRARAPTQHAQTHARTHALANTHADTLMTPPGRCQTW